MSSAVQLDKEGHWLLQNRAINVTKQADQLLRECCKRLNATHKLDGSAARTSPAVEKLTLVSRSSHESLNATVILHGENIVQTDVNLKYAKSPLGYYRATAISEAQWKLQQLQDASNQCVRALHVLTKGLKKYDEAAVNRWEPERLHELVFSFMAAVKEHIRLARSSLTMPRRKSLVELCQFPPIKCFNPPLPHDILLSYYIASAKLVCAAYQVPSARGGGEPPTIYLAECQLPKLYEVIQLLNQAFALVHCYLYDCSILQTAAAMTQQDSSTAASPAI